MKIHNARWYVKDSETSYRKEPCKSLFTLNFLNLDSGTPFLFNLSILWEMLPSRGINLIALEFEYYHAALSWCVQTIMINTEYTAMENRKILFLSNFKKSSGDRTAVYNICPSFFWNMPYPFLYIENYKCKSSLQTWWSFSYWQKSVAVFFEDL